MIDNQEFELRCEAIGVAKTLVEEITEKHEPTSYEISSAHGVMVAPTKNTVTAGEQVVDMLLNVGSWLLGEARP